MPRSFKSLLAAMALLSVAVMGIGLLYHYQGPMRLMSALESGERPEGAREELTRILLKNPDNLRLQGLLLRLEIEDGDYLAAQRRLSMLMLRAPKSHEALANACFLKLKQAWWSEAEASCRAALNASGRRPVEDLNRLAVAYLMDQKPAMALPFLNEARTKAPQDPKVLNNLGHYYILTRNYDEAIKYLDRAIKLDPGFVTARHNLARVYFETWKMDRCAQELKAVLSYEPGDKYAFFHLVQINLLYLGDVIEAQKYADMAIKLGLTPEETRSLKNLLEAPVRPKPGAPMTPAAPTGTGSASSPAGVPLSPSPAPGEGAASSASENWVPGASSDRAAGLPGSMPPPQPQLTAPSPGGTAQPSPPGPGPGSAPAAAPGSTAAP